MSGRAIRLGQLVRPSFPFRLKIEFRSLTPCVSFSSHSGKCGQVCSVNNAASTTCISGQCYASTFFAKKRNRSKLKLIDRFFTLFRVLRSWFHSLIRYLHQDCRYYLRRESHFYPSLSLENPRLTRFFAFLTVQQLRCSWQQVSFFLLERFRIGLQELCLSTDELSIRLRFRLRKFILPQFVERLIELVSFSLPLSSPSIRLSD